MIRIEENKLTAEELSFLQDSVGWGRYNEKIASEALENTLYSVSIYKDNKLVGCGRIIGDKTIFLYIHDIIVKPECQSQKIGTMVMNKLLEKVEEYKKINPNLRLYLGAVKGKEEFYKKFGFITRKEAELGEGMIWKKEDANG